MSNKDSGLTPSGLTPQPPLLQRGGEATPLSREMSCRSNFPLFTREGGARQGGGESALSFFPALHTLVWGTESWEVSAVPGNESVIADGPLAGQPLSAAVALWGERLLGRRGMEQGEGGFPLLAKIIDAKDDLSIQVHPNETLAQQRHHCHGKTEMWFVLDAQPGASLLAGFSKPLPREEYAARVEDGTIVNYLARHEVHPGDVFFIPAGRVHAICGGVRVCEIQQSSDITYRLFDYHRLGLDGKPRQLHVEEAIDAIDFSVLPEYRTRYEHTPNVPVPIVQCPYFNINLIEATKPMERLLKNRDSFVLLSLLEGEAVISQGLTPQPPNTHSPTPSLAKGEEDGLTSQPHFLQSGRGDFVAKGEVTVLIPAACADYTIVPVGSGPVRLMETYL